MSDKEQDSIRQKQLWLSLLGNLRTEIDTTKMFLNNVANQLKNLEEEILISLNSERDKGKDSGDNLIHPAFLESTYTQNSIGKAADIVIDYILGVKYEAELKMIAPNHLKLKTSPLGMLWLKKIQVFADNTGTPKSILDPAQAIKGNFFTNILYGSVEKNSWPIDINLLGITRMPEFIDYFGDATTNNPDLFERTRSRYILLVELIRWSSIDPFENGSKYNAKIGNLRKVESMIYPNGLIKRMREVEDKESGEKKSVKVEKFRSYMFTRLKEASGLTQESRKERDTARVLNAPGPDAPTKTAPRSVFMVNLSPDMPRHGDGKRFYGSEKNSLKSDTPTNSQTVFTGIFLCRIGVTNGEKKKAIFRLLKVSKPEVQRESGVIWAHVIRNDIYERNQYEEEFTYEQWLGMEPYYVDLNEIVTITEPISTLYKEEKLRDMWITKRGSGESK